MQIELDQDIFQNPANYHDFQFLIRMLSDGDRYGFFVDIPKVEDTDFYKDLHKRDKELIRVFFNRAMNDSRKSSHLVSQDGSNDSFSLEEAKRFFNQQVLVILENSLNDAYFIDALIKNFPKRSKAILTHYNQGWIRNENGGGCTNIQNLIRGLLQQYNQLPKNNAAYIRCMVVIDSDKEYPDQIKNERTLLADFLNANNIPYHFLFKREMENYLPDETIAKINDPDGFLTAYLRLSPVQKDYFDLEKGFPTNKNFNSLPQEIQDLYQNISEGDKSTFRQHQSPIANFKAEFPKYFEDVSVTQASLKSRVKHVNGQENELEEILDKIKSLL